MAPPPTQTIESARGTLEIAFPAPGIFVGTIRGHYARELLAPYMEGMGSLTSHASFIVFHQWIAMTSYDSICRQTMTQWAIEHRAATEAHHVLLKSKLVAMGVATASLIVGGNLVVSHTDRTMFDLALRDATKKRARS